MEHSSLGAYLSCVELPLYPRLAHLFSSPTCFHLLPLPSHPSLDYSSKHSPLSATLSRLSNMAPFNSLRDPFSGSQMHSRSIYPDTSRHHRSSGSPLLISASMRMRASSSPRLVHGNSPLLNAVNVTPTSKNVEAFASSPGQFSDAEVEEGSSERRVVPSA